VTSVCVAICRSSEPFGLQPPLRRAAIGKGKAAAAVALTVATIGMLVMARYQLAIRPLASGSGRNSKHADSDRRSPKQERCYASWRRARSMIKGSQRFATPCQITLLAIGLGAGAAPDAKKLSSRPRSATPGRRLTPCDDRSEA
jgi:hypothetical protein